MCSSIRTATCGRCEISHGGKDSYPRTVAGVVQAVDFLHLCEQLGPEERSCLTGQICRYSATRTKMLGKQSEVCL